MGFLSDILCTFGAHDKHPQYVREGSCEVQVSCIRPDCDWVIFEEPHQFITPQDYQNYYRDDSSCEVMGVCSRCGFGPGPEPLAIIHDWAKWQISWSGGQRVTERVCHRCGEYQQKAAGPELSDVA